MLKRKCMYTTWFYQEKKKKIVQYILGVAIEPGPSVNQICGCTSGKSISSTSPVHILLFCEWGKLHCNQKKKRGGGGVGGHFGQTTTSNNSSY